MTDINKQIEEEAREYASRYPTNIPYIGTNIKEIAAFAYEVGRRETLYSSRWRKVSEELPPIDVRLLVKLDNGDCEVDVKSIIRGFYWENEGYNILEWKPID